MARSSREKFTRTRRLDNRLNQRAYFGLIVEGQTEKHYFEQFEGKNIDVRVITAGASDASAMLAQIEALRDELRRAGTLRKGDQLWIVCDKDDLSESDLERLFAWSFERENTGDRGIGLSVPKFEYWVLLHYEDGNGVASKSICDERLALRDPHYKKARPFTFARSQIEAATKRGFLRVGQMPRTYREFEEAGNVSGGGTTVHLLVQRLLENSRPE